MDSGSDEKITNLTEKIKNKTEDKKKKNKNISIKSSLLLDRFFSGMRLFDKQY